MEDVINKINWLKEKYPKEVKTFNPAAYDRIIEVENFLGMKLDDDIKKLYKYSDGIGFLDYALLSISNKRFQLLTNLNTKESLNETGRLEFICTTGGKSFRIDIHHDLPQTSSVWFKDEDDSTEIVVAQSVHEFFLKFLDKTEILLQHFNRSDYVAYFEDDNMPPYLSKW